MHGMMPPAPQYDHQRHHPYNHYAHEEQHVRRQQRPESTQNNTTYRRTSPGSSHSQTSSPSSPRAVQSRSARRASPRNTGTRHSPSPSPSSASSYTSSPYTSNEAHSGSASSSLGTSPLAHADPVVAAATAATVSPRTRDLIQAQRDLYQRKNAPPSLSPQHTQHSQLSSMLHAGTALPRSQQTPAVAGPSRNGASDVIMTSPSAGEVASSSTINGAAYTTAQSDRGVKSRRASSGGSRIPERGRSYSNTSHGQDEETHGAAHVRDSPRPSLAYPSSSSSTNATPTPGSTAAASARRPLPHLDLANYPQHELLRILAALLHQISTANDSLRPASSSSSTSSSATTTNANSTPTADGEDDDTVTDTAAAAAATSLADRRSSVTTAAMSALGTPSSTLCFHARNVPSISIESYLLRILKYCPTTNDVFLSLLVYFDRMSRMGVGADPRGNGEHSVAGADAGLPQAQQHRTQQPHHDEGEEDRVDGSATPTAHPGMKGFAIDSYNVHRLVIAGVTVASKFFSDVFYTNSRYAKVGGLPVHELNQLELQFLLLNDFHLMITMDEIQRYADQLLAYSQGGTDGAAQGANNAEQSAVPPPPPTQQLGNSQPDRSAAAAVRPQDRR